MIRKCNSIATWRPGKNKTFSKLNTVTSECVIESLLLFFNDSPLISFNHHKVPSFYILFIFITNTIYTLHSLVNCLRKVKKTKNRDLK